MNWPHPDRCRCAECVRVGRDTRAEQRAEAKRRIAEILAKRPKLVSFEKNDDAAA